MNYSNLDKKVVISWRISRLIRLILVAAILLIPTIIISQQDFAQSFFNEYSSIIYAIEIIIIAYMFLSLIIYPIIEYRQWGYIIAEDRVVIKHGIFFVGITIIPIIRIQHITIEQGVINRKLGISNVMVHTASGVFAIEGVADDTANSIADTLKSRLYSRLEASDL